MGMALYFTSTKSKIRFAQSSNQIKIIHRTEVQVFNALELIPKLNTNVNETRYTFAKTAEKQFKN
jgi:hypothetical protein